MRRRSFLSLPSIAGLPAAGLPSLAFAQQRKLPNIVLITGDHLRWDHVAANGNPHILTPHMDRLARSGVSFTMAHTVGVACAPNRCSMFTGRYPSVHGVISNGVKMPETEVTLTHILRDAGYYTGQMGKLHFWPHSGRNHREYHPPYGFHHMRLSDEPGCYEDDFGRWLLAQGPEVRRKANVAMPGERGDFNYYTFEGDERTTHAHWTASETIHFMEESNRQQPGRPFFVNVGFYHPHPPLNPPASQLAFYKDRALPARRFRPDEADFAPPNMKKTLLRLARTPEDTWTAYRKHFYAMVSELDRNIGRIIDSVERLGQMDNTLFILTSDHGDYLGDHNLNGKSAMPYDGSMRVPLIFRGPGIPSGVSSKELCEMVDIMPTTLDLLGIAAPKGNQGASLVPVMKGGPGKPVVIQEGRENRIVRTRRGKYCLWKGKENYEVLFDHQNDPDEFRNVAADPASQAFLGEMRLALSQRMMEIVDPLPEKVAPY